MNNQKKYLIYSLGFFILSNIMLFGSQLRSMIIIVSILLLCSILSSMWSLRKAPVETKKLFNFIPLNIPSILAIILIVVSFVYIKMIVLGFLAYL